MKCEPKKKIGRDGWAWLWSVEHVGPNAARHVIWLLGQKLDQRKTRKTLSRAIILRQPGKVPPLPVCYFHLSQLYHLFCLVVIWTTVQPYNPTALQPPVSIPYNPNPKPRQLKQTATDDDVDDFNFACEWQQNEEKDL